jgi:hypothetical protein
MYFVRRRHADPTAISQLLQVLIAFVGFPDPFAVATINGEQTKTTSVVKRTLNPYWNESFDLYVYWDRPWFHLDKP